MEKQTAVTWGGKPSTRLIKRCAPTPAVSEGTRLSCEPAALRKRRRAGEGREEAAQVQRPPPQLPRERTVWRQRARGSFLKARAGRRPQAHHVSGGAAGAGQVPRVGQGRAGKERGGERRAGESRYRRRPEPQCGQGTLPQRDAGHDGSRAGGALSFSSLCLFSLPSPPPRG